MMPATTSSLLRNKLALGGDINDTLVSGGPLDVHKSEEPFLQAKCVSFCGIGAKKFKRGPTPLNGNSDSLLAKELTQLSLSERELALSDLHGVADVVDETPEMVEKAFEDLEVEIGKIKKKGAYDKALFLSPGYVKDRDFRIKFLRADRFNPSAAAQRLVNHFELKMKLFGYDRLARDITFNDLSSQGKHDLMTGGLWVLRGYDRAGRKIILVQVEHAELNSDNLENLWFWFMIAAEDPKAQKNGIVDILFCVRESTQKPFCVEKVMKTADVYTSLPFRLAGIHVCSDDKRLPAIMNIFQMAIGTRYRIRFRAHYGSPIEMKYELLSYGIPTQLLPLDSEGRLDMQDFHQFIEERKALEEKREAQKRESGVILHPGPHDVLLGRGRPYQEFPGNNNLAQLVELRQDDYEEGSRYEKAVLVLDVMQQIREMNGKFLRRVESNDTVIWEEVDEETAKEKVGNTFRTKRKLEKRKQDKKRKDL